MYRATLHTSKSVLAPRTPHLDKHTQTNTPLPQKNQLILWSGHFATPVYNQIYCNCMQFSKFKPYLCDYCRYAELCKIFIIGAIQNNIYFSFSIPYFGEYKHVLNLFLFKEDQYIKQAKKHCFTALSGCNYQACFTSDHNQPHCCLNQI